MPPRPSPKHQTCRTLSFVGVPVWLVALGLTAATPALLRVPISPSFYAAVLAGAAFVYLAERMVPAPEDAANHPGRTQWVQQHRRVLAVVGGGWLALGLWAASGLRPATLAGGALLAAASVAYARPLLGRARLKTIAVLKTALVAGAWGVATVALPLVEAGHPASGAALALLAVRMLTVAANVLVHDWLDRRGDAASGVASLPQAWSWRRVQRVAWGLLGGAALLMLLMLLMLPQAGWLVFVEMAGLVLFALVLRRAPTSALCYGVALDLLVAWPLVTALVR